jgi:hypothetical protein
VVPIRQRTGLLSLRLYRCLREAFPTLPERSQFNRLVRFYTEIIEEVALYLAAGAMEEDHEESHPYEALDSSAMPVRNAKRRGAG